MEEKRRAYRPTILNLFAGLFLFSCIVMTIINYKELSAGEGWGMVGMIGLGGVGLGLFLIDFIIQKAFRNKMAIYIAGSIVLILAILLFFL